MWPGVKKVKQIGYARARLLDPRLITDSFLPRAPAVPEERGKFCAGDSVADLRGGGRRRAEFAVAGRLLLLIIECSLVGPAVE